MEKIRILVVDDHPIIGEGLEFFLNQDPDLLVLGNARNGMEGLRLVRQWNPDVVVLDLSMPELHGLEAIRLYLEVNPRIDIVVYSGRTEEAIIDQALRAGARGYVLKGSSPAELKQAIHHVRAGGHWLSPQFNQWLMKKYLQKSGAETSPESPFEQLTEKEMQILLLLVNGKETKEIGQLLGIRPSTVANYRTALFKRLKVKNIVELTRFAIRHGLTDT